MTVSWPARGAAGCATGRAGRNTGFVIDLPYKRDLEGNDITRKQKLLSLNRTLLYDEVTWRTGGHRRWRDACRHAGTVIFWSIAVI